MKLASLFTGRQRRQPRSASALREDNLRDTIIAETEQDVPRFGTLTQMTPTVETDEIHGSAWDTFGEAVRDVARAAFSYDEPRVRPRDEVLPSHLFNREVIAQMLNDPQFSAARMYTSGNAAESLFTSIAMADVMQEHAQAAREHVERSEEAAQEEQAAQSAQEMIDQLRNKAQEYPDDPIIQHGLAERMREEIAKREAAKQRLGQIAQAHATSNAAAVAAEIVQAAAGEMLDTAEMGGFFAGLGPGANAGMSPETQIELGRKLLDSPKLHEIAKMAGRLIRDMRFKRQARTKNVHVEPVGITTGRDIGLMLPHELARAYMPNLRPLWVKDYAERSLLVYEMSGKNPAGKGPIVFAMDGSGSMNGEKIIWAQAVGLALLSIAQREKRAFCAIQFSSAGQVKHWLFPARKAPEPELVLDMISHFYGGGTKIYQGLDRAVEVIRDAGQFRAADVVLATDGQATYGEADKQAVEELRAMDVRIHGISILTRSNRYLAQACEWHCDVSDLAGSNEATDRLAEQLT